MFSNSKFLPRVCAHEQILAFFDNQPENSVHMDERGAYGEGGRGTSKKACQGRENLTRAWAYSCGGSKCLG